MKFNTEMQVSSGLAGVGFNYVVIDGELHTCLLRKSDFSVPAAAMLTPTQVSVCVWKSSALGPQTVGLRASERSLGPLHTTQRAFLLAFLRLLTMCTAKVKSLCNH